MFLQLNSDDFPFFCFQDWTSVAKVSLFSTLLFYARFFIYFIWFEDDWGKPHWKTCRNHLQPPPHSNSFISDSWLSGGKKCQGSTFKSDPYFASRGGLHTHRETHECLVVLWGHWKRFLVVLWSSGAAINTLTEEVHVQLQVRGGGVHLGSLPAQLGGRYLNLQCVCTPLGSGKGDFGHDIHIPRCQSGNQQYAWLRIKTSYESDCFRGLYSD